MIDFNKSVFFFSLSLSTVRIYVCTSSILLQHYNWFVTTHTLINHLRQVYALIFVVISFFSSILWRKRSIHSTQNIKKGKWLSICVYFIWLETLVQSWSSFLHWLLSSQFKLYWVSTIIIILVSIWILLLIARERKLKIMVIRGLITSNFSIMFSHLSVDRSIERRLAMNCLNMLSSISLGFCAQSMSLAFSFFRHSIWFIVSLLLRCWGITSVSGSNWNDCIHSSCSVSVLLWLFNLEYSPSEWIHLCIFMIIQLAWRWRIVFRFVSFRYSRTSILMPILCSKKYFLRYLRIEMSSFTLHCHVLMKITKSQQVNSLFHRIVDLAWSKKIWYGLFIFLICSPNFPKDVSKWK